LGVGTAVSPPHRQMPDDLFAYLVSLRARRPRLPTCARWLANGASGS